MPRFGPKLFSNLTIMKKFNTTTHFTQRKMTKKNQPKKEGESSDLETSVVCIIWVSRLDGCSEILIIVICKDDLLGHDNSATVV